MMRSKKRPGYNLPVDRCKQAVEIINATIPLWEIAVIEDKKPRTGWENDCPFCEYFFDDQEAENNSGCPRCPLHIEFGGVDRIGLMCTTEYYRFDDEEDTYSATDFYELLVDLRSVWVKRGRLSKEQQAMTRINGVIF